MGSQCFHRCLSVILSTVGGSGYLVLGPFRGVSLVPGPFWGWVCLGAVDNGMRSASGRYASYWNSFLLREIIIPYHLRTQHIYRPQRSWGKVMFYRRLWFCPRGVSSPGTPWDQTPPPRAYPPPDQTPPRDGHCCGRCASYWNAFLFEECCYQDFLLLPANEVWGNVMFSQTCVSHSVHQVGEGKTTHGQRPPQTETHHPWTETPPFPRQRPPQTKTPPGQRPIWIETPPPTTIKSGRYASYWNAFSFISYIYELKHTKLNIPPKHSCILRILRKQNFLHHE